ncbi:MAG: hypothetical protein ABSH41_05670 [Syntrophobacteraceae bacterium]
MEEEKDHHKEVEIIIDRKHFKLESPTTGAELYLLAGISGGGYDLYRETKGPGDDEFIQNNAAKVILHHGDHFYTAISTLNPGGIV